jgi:undecaprenyl-diphosphatase
LIFLLAILFGIVEGVTEFLPISSTAHLRLLKPMFSIALDDPYWKMFDVVIQLGAVLCLPVYFRKRIADFARSFPKDPLTGEKDVVGHPVTLVMIAFVLTAAFSFALKRTVSANLQNLQVMGGAMLIGGAVMWSVDALFTRPRTQDVAQMNILQATWVGLIQVLAAVFPGVSRSMATIAAGQTAGLSRAAALEFSFFLSMPTMAAACIYELYGAIKPGHDETGLTPTVMTSTKWAALALGFVVSFVVALAVVAWFMNWVKRRGFVPFAVYRIILGLIVLIVLASR